MRFFGHDIPRLSWLNAKTFRQGNGGRKNRSGYKQEHIAALVDDVIFVPTPVVSPSESTPSETIQ
jgi:hypothetical protein